MAVGNRSVGTSVGVRRALTIAASIALVVLAGSACGGSAARTSGAPAVSSGLIPAVSSGLIPAEATRAAAPRLGPGALVVIKGAAAGPVSADTDHLVWESGPIQSDAFEPDLHDRVLSTGTTRTIAKNVDPLFGVASTSQFVFYARTSGKQTALLEVSHGGTDPRVVTHALVTPIASRGDVVAWGERSGPWQQVMALDATSRRQWTVARMPNCSPSGCYRLDAVTVADDGIVFTRAAVGSQPSLVVRRAFGDRRTHSLAIARDSQPDLVPSSTGALYYALSRGWYRWDFGDSRPRPVAFANDPAKSLIRHENTVWYWLSRHGCDFQVESSTDANTRAVALVAARRLESLAPGETPACTQLSGFAWSGRQAIASWVIAPAASEAAHVDLGLRGVVVAGSQPSG